MSSLEVFRLVATEFSEVPDETVLQYTEVAKASRDFTVYPKSKQDLATALLTAHLIWVANASGSVEGASGGGNGGYGGEVAMEKEGDLQRSYSTTSGGSSHDSWYRKSVYGQQLLALDATVFITLAMTRMNDLV